MRLSGFLFSLLFSLRPSLCSPLRLSLSVFHFFFLNLDFYLFLFHVDVLGARSLVRKEVSGPLANNTPLTSQEPTELLLTGCLTEFNLILKSK